MSNPRSSPEITVAVEEGLLDIQHRPLYYRRLVPLHGRPGAKPTLVFLHEGLGCTAMWHDFPEKVVKHTGLGAIIYDRDGYGRSAADPRPRDHRYLHVEAETVLPRLLDRLRVERAILIGHSDGGSIALLAAAACPERMAGIVTEAAHVFVEPITLNGIRATVASYEARNLEQRLARYHGPKARALFEAWSKTWLSDAFRQWNIEDCLGQIQCPALVMQGREDPYGSERQVQVIVDGIGRRASPMLIRACGHAPHRDAPQRVCHAMVAFTAALA
jgi:pimeloyl-ACP methyl ester carboxylesterase